MGSGYDTLLPEPSSDDNDNKDRRHFGKYFRKKLGIFAAILSIPGAVALIALHGLILKPIIVNYIQDEDYFRNFTAFEVSGVGIVAGIVSLIFVILTFKTSLRPTYAKVLLTFLAQGICIALYLGVGSFAIVSPMWVLRYKRRSLLFCECADSEGNLERNGTNPDSYDCTTYNPKYHITYKAPNPIPERLRNKMEPCSLIDGQVEEITEKFLMCWIMVGIAILQSCIALIPVIMSVRTIWNLGDTFNKLTQTCSRWGQSDENDDPENATVGQAYLNKTSLRTLKVITRIQLAIGIISGIIVMSVDRYAYQIWHVLEFYAFISYVMVNWLITPGNLASYARITVVTFAHFLIGFLTLIPIILMPGIGCVMLLQMLLYGIVCALLFGSLKKMATVLTNTFMDAIQKNASHKFEPPNDSASIHANSA